MLLGILLFYFCATKVQTLQSWENTILEDKPFTGVEVAECGITQRKNVFGIIMFKNSVKQHTCVIIIGTIRILVGNK